VEGVWIYTEAFGWNYTELSIYNFTSGDVIYFDLYELNTQYAFEFVLSDGSVAAIQYYTTGACNNLCSFTSSQVFNDGCDGDIQMVDFVANFTGDCTVETLWINTALTGWTEIPLVGNFYSGNPIPILLYEDNTLHTYYYVLSNGTESINYSYTSLNCQVSGCSNLDIDYIDTG
jgi:hypothetical protein